MDRFKCIRLTNTSILLLLRWRCIWVSTIKSLGHRKVNSQNLPVLCRAWYHNPGTPSIILSWYGVDEVRLSAKKVYYGKRKGFGIGLQRTQKEWLHNMLSPPMWCISLWRMYLCCCLCSIRCWLASSRTALPLQSKVSNS